MGTERKLLQSRPVECLTCPNITGKCQLDGICLCNEPYIGSKNGSKKCSYKAKSKLVAFLLSFFVGELGFDWFWLAQGDAGYIVAGIFKLLSGGCCGIWWLIDWIRLVADAFPDGNEMPLFKDM